MRRKASLCHIILAVIFHLASACNNGGSEAAGRGADSSVVYGILGESVTFPLNIQEPQKVRIIAWTSNSSVAFVKPGLQGAPPEVTVTRAVYEGRLDVIAQNYDLVIRNLRMEDAGTYKADINEENTPTTTTTKHYHLQIYPRLGKPKIIPSLKTSANNFCNVTLTCSLEKEEKNVTYSWSPSGEKSNVLQIFESPKDQNLTYTCTAQNPVSNSSDSITAQQLCTDNPRDLRSRMFLSGLAAPLFILIPLSVFLFYWNKRRQKRIDLEGDVPKGTIYAQVSRSNHPTESRIYDEIPESKGMTHKEKPMHTIYCSVQHSEKVQKNSTKDNSPPKTLGNEIVV